MKIDCNKPCFYIEPSSTELPDLFELSSLSIDFKVRLADENDDETEKLKKADFYYSIDIPSRPKGRPPLMFNVSGLDVKKMKIKEEVFRKFEIVMYIRYVVLAVAHDAVQLILFYLHRLSTIFIAFLQLKQGIKVDRFSR